MENKNEVENKIFLSIKEKVKTLSPEEVEKIISDDLKSNGYIDWQLDYAVERIKKMLQDLKEKEDFELKVEETVKKKLTEKETPKEKIKFGGKYIIFNYMNILSIILGVFGIMSLFWGVIIGMIIGVISLIFGILAKKQKQKLAILGIVLGIISIILGYFVITYSLDIKAVSEVLVTSLVAVFYGIFTFKKSKEDIVEKEAIKRIKKMEIQDNKIYIRKNSKINIVSVCVGVIAIAFFAISVSRIILIEVANKNIENKNIEFIKIVVEQLKNNTALPYQVDPVTTLTDITPEQKAIRFHYVVSDTGTNNEYPQFKDEVAFKEYLLSNYCLDEHFLSILKEEINLEYLADFKSTSKTLLVSLSKEDCSNYIPQLKNYDDLKPIKVEPK